jgi:hypothetical protein
MLRHRKSNSMERRTLARPGPASWPGARCRWAASAGCSTADFGERWLTQRRPTSSKGMTKDVARAAARPAPRIHIVDEARVVARSLDRDADFGCLAVIAGRPETQEKSPGRGFWLSRRSQTSINGSSIGHNARCCHRDSLHSLWVIPQLVQRNRVRSPIVRGDHGSESIDDNFKKPSQTGHGRSS